MTTQKKLVRDSEALTEVKSDSEEIKMKEEEEPPTETSSLPMILKIGILILICSVSFMIRVFSVIKYESVIHEFDPWFNYRSTKFTLQNGFYEFWNWYDSESWYPIGRVVGGTVYPGIMFTGTLLKYLMDWVALPLDIRNICVFMAPLFSIFQCLSAYLFTTESTNRPEAGFFAALFMAIIPSIIARGCAGSYDNEAVAVWALMNTFYLWIKACNTGSIMWSVLCTLNYFYMVASWGGYNFIINMIPVFVLGTLFINRFNMKIYVAYSIFYTFGSLMAMLITFVNFQVVRSSEHLASHLTFVAMNIFVVIMYIKDNLEAKTLKTLFNFGILLISFGLIALFAYLTLSGKTRISGRVMKLINPNFETDGSALVESVAEHAPTNWPGFFKDMHVLLLFVPVGFYYSLVHEITYGKLFVAMYGVFTVYFACAMTRLMIVLAPAICILAAIGVSRVTTRAINSIKYQLSSSSSNSNRAQHSMPLDSSVILLFVIFLLLKQFVGHSSFISNVSHSSPTFIIQSGSVARGDRYLFDDFREAYWWLNKNTPKDSKILAWWDYGY